MAVKTIAERLYEAYLTGSEAIFYSGSDEYQFTPEGLKGYIEDNSFATGTSRQVVGFDNNGEQTAVTLGWAQFSDQPDPPSFSVGALLWNQDINKFGFGELSQEPLSNSIPMRIPGLTGGQIKAVDAVENDDVVTLGQLNTLLGNIISRIETLEGI